MKKTNVIIQACGIEVSESDIISQIKDKWVSDGNLLKDMKSVTIYVKPEEKKVYYVINEEINGDLDI